MIPSIMQVVGRRVDALRLAYRVTLDPLFVEALRQRGAVAYKHGRAAFSWRLHVPEGFDRATGDRNGPIRLGGLRARWADESDIPTEDVRAVWGELKYSRTAKCWNVINEPYFQLRIDAQAPGGTERIDPRTREVVHEGGWTIEIKFYAQWLAEVGLDVAIREAEAMASLCGEVHEQRLRQIDLCADVAGWEIGEEDVRRLVKRPRARWQKEYGGVLAVDAVGRAELLGKKRGGRTSKKEREEEERAQDFGRGALQRRQITGLSVGRGGAMMTRIYDKRVELERAEERRLNEEARWRAEGWDGMARVTRVEFQIRGSVIQEFGIRDPSRVKDVEWGVSEKGRVVVVAQKDAIDEDGCVLGLVDRLDYLWRSCLEWVRLVEPDYTKSGKLKSPANLEDDARWALLREVTFATARAPSTLKRFRVRTAASAAMALGVALSRAARDGKLVPLDEEYGEAFEDADAAARELGVFMTRLMLDQATTVIEDLCQKHGGPIGAYEHLTIRNNAAFIRFKERRRADADLSTGPPHGGGPRSPSPPSRREDDSTGGCEDRRAVA